MHCSHDKIEDTRTCGICLDSDDFRVLTCGHAICFKCLESIYASNYETILCPYDRSKDTRKPHALPTLEQFRGKVYNCISDDTREGPRFGKTKRELGGTCYDSDDSKFLGCTPSKRSNAARQSETLPNPEQFSYVSEDSSGRSGSIRGTRLCAVCLDSDDFRVLECRHAFCFQCLRCIYETNEGMIICPFDRLVDLREPRALPKPNRFHGEIIYHISDDPIDFNMLIDRLIQQRKTTVEHLRDVASFLSKKEVKLAISKITGSATGVSNLTFLLRKVINN